MNEELQKKSTKKSETEPVKNPNFEPPSLKADFESPVSYPMPRTENFAPIQAKLTIGAAGDKYEQEADNIARKVVKEINSPKVPPVQTSVEPVSPELPSDDNSLGGKIRRQVIKDSQPKFQTIPQQNITPQNAEFHQKIRRQVVQDNVPQIQMMGLKGGTATADFEKSLNSTRGGGASLDSGFREKVEPVMGADFSQVKVHTDTKADNLSRSINAQAFTSGNDIYFAQGKFNTSTPKGQELVTHELTHNMQQTGSGTGVQSKSVQRVEDGNGSSQNHGLVKPSLQSQESVIHRQIADQHTRISFVKKYLTQKKQGVSDQNIIMQLNQLQEEGFLDDEDIAHIKTMVFASKKALPNLETESVDVELEDVNPVTASDVENLPDFSEQFEIQEAQPEITSADVKLLTRGQMTAKGFKNLTDVSLIIGRGSTLKHIEWLLTKAQENMDIADPKVLLRASNYFELVYRWTNRYIANHENEKSGPRKRRLQAMKEYRDFLKNQASPTFNRLYQEAKKQQNQPQQQGVRGMSIGGGMDMLSVSNPSNSAPSNRSQSLAVPNVATESNQPNELDISLEDLKIATDNRLTAAGFQQATYESLFTGRGGTLKQIEASLQEYDQLELTNPEKISDAIHIMFEVYGRVANWLDYHEADQEGKRKNRYPKMVIIETFLKEEVIPALLNIKTSLQKADIYVDDTSKKVITIKNAFEGDARSCFNFLEKLVDVAVPNVGDKAKLDVMFKIPILADPTGSGTAYISFRLVTQADRKKREELTLRSEVFVGVGANVLNFFDIRIEGGAFFEVLGKNSKEAAKLVSWSLYHQFGGPGGTLSDYMWSNRNQNADEWNELMLNVFQENKKAYAEMGGVGGVEASFNAVVLKGKGRFQQSSGSRVEKASLDSEANKEDESISREVTVKEYSGELKIGVGTAKFKYKSRYIRDPDQFTSIYDKLCQKQMPREQAREEAENASWWAYEKGVEVNIIPYIRIIGGSGAYINAMTTAIAGALSAVSALKIYQNHRDLKKATSETETQKNTRHVAAVANFAGDIAESSPQFASPSIGWGDYAAKIFEAKQLNQYSNLDASAIYKGINVYIKIKSKQEDHDNEAKKIEKEKELAFGTYEALGLTSISEVASGLGLDLVNIKGEKLTKMFTISNKKKFALKPYTGEDPYTKEEKYFNIGDIVEDKSTFTADKDDDGKYIIDTDNDTGMPQGYKYVPVFGYPH